MKIIGTVFVLLLSMPVIHAAWFGPDDLGEAILYYWMFGAPALLILVPLLGYPLLALLRSCRLDGVTAIMVATVLCAFAAGLAISGAHGVIPEVIIIAATFGGLFGFTWTLLAQAGLRTGSRSA